MIIFDDYHACCTWQCQHAPQHRQHVVVSTSLHPACSHLHHAVSTFALLRSSHPVLPGAVGSCLQIHTQQVLVQLLSCFSHQRSFITIQAFLQKWDKFTFVVMDIRKYRQTQWFWVYKKSSEMGCMWKCQGTDAISFVLSVLVKKLVFWLIYLLSDRFFQLLWHAKEHFYHLHCRMTRTKNGSHQSPS